MAADPRLPALKMSIPSDVSYSGILTCPGRHAFDIAAPALARYLPTSGVYRLVRFARIPKSDTRMRDSYGPVVLYYLKANGATLAVHGGFAPNADTLYNPDRGIVMHDEDLIQIAEALTSNKVSQQLDVSYEHLGWLRKKFRSDVIPRRALRMAAHNLPTPVSRMREVRRPQYGDDTLSNNDLFWIAVHTDHEEDQREIARSNPERDAPFIPGGGTERGAGADGSFDDTSRANDDRARTVRARQFVFGAAAGLTADSASEAIDRGAAIIAGDKEAAVETDASGSPKDEPADVDTVEEKSEPAAELPTETEAEADSKQDAEQDVAEPAADTSDSSSAPTESPSAAPSE